MNVAEEQRGDLIFITVTDIGSNHRVLCLPNQDYAGFQCIDQDFVIAVSDGVGSCKKADEGSKFAVDAVMKLFIEIKMRALHLDNTEMANYIISAWQSSIVGGSANDYCATIKAVIKIGNVAKMISLGDGIAAITSNGMSIIAPTEETNFTNETKCLNSSISSESFWIMDFNLDIHQPFVVFCCTDGVANSLVMGKELEFVKEIEDNTTFSSLKDELTDLINEIGDYSFDDKTLGVVKYERKN